MFNKKNILALIALGSITLNTFATAENLSGTTLNGNTTNSGATTNSGTTTNSGEILSTKDLVEDNKKIIISGIDFVDDKTLIVKLGEKLAGISSNSEAKVLEDIKVNEVSKDLKNLKKILLKLDSDLVSGVNYSIISVSESLDTSIDFSYSGNNSQIKNTFLQNDETGIEYISVMDPKTIEIYLNKEANLDKYDFKTYKELKTDNMFLDTTNLNLKLLDNLLSSKDYILILTLKDLENKDIEMENSLYDFTTPNNIVSSTVKEDVIPETTKAIENVSSDTTENGSGELNGSGVLNGTSTGSGEEIENLAMKVTQTPDTGTKTNIMLFFTFIISLFIFIIKRKNIKL